MVPESDADLVRVLAEGDEDARKEALGQLFRKHHGRVLNVAYRVLNDRARAEDVVQEVFVRLPRVARSFRGDASFTSWLYRITVNRAIDQRRREARRPAARMGDIPADAEQNALPNRARPRRPDDDARTTEREERVQKAMMSLSPKLRAVVVLRYIEGLSYDELAEAMHCSIGTIKSRLNRAHTALTRIMGADAPPSAGSDGDDA